MGRRLGLCLSFCTALASAGTAQASPRNMGVMVDAGVPDGFNGSFVYRPVPRINVHAGLGTNLVSMGLRAGASLYVLPTHVTPSVNIEAGHYFSGNANNTANRLGLASDSDSPILRQFGYDYVNFHLGVDVGRERFSFYFHAGFSALRGTLHNLDEVVAEDANEDLTFRVGEDATASAWTPSGRFGFLYYF